MDYQSEWEKEHQAQREAEEARKAAEEARAMLALAQAMHAGTELPHAELARRCSERVEKYVGWLAEAVEQFGPEAKKGMALDHPTVELSWHKADPSMLRGEARVRTPGCVHYYEFKCKPEDAVEMSGRAAVRAVMGSHPWLGEGFELELLEDQDPGSLEVREMLLELPTMGAPGALLAEMVALETRWNHERWGTGVYLERMVNEAARAGLLPSGFAGSKIRLAEGWPGETTKVVAWEARSIGFGGARGPCALGSLSSQTPGSDDAVWELPSLDQGPMALWEAFAKSAAACQARGWTSMPSHFSSDEAQGVVRSTAESMLLREEAPEPRVEAAPKRKPRAL